MWVEPTLVPGPPLPLSLLVVQISWRRHGKNYHNNRWSTGNKASRDQHVAQWLHGRASGKSKTFLAELQIAHAHSRYSLDFHYDLLPWEPDAQKEVCTVVASFPRVQSQLTWWKAWYNSCVPKGSITANVVEGLVYNSYVPKASITANVVEGLV